MPQRVDDQSIKNDDWLLRRILNNPAWYGKNDDGSYYVSSAAFIDNYTNEVSVDQEKLTTWEKALRHFPNDGLARLRAEIPRSCEHIVVSDPIDDPDPEKANPAHALICPPENMNSSQRKKQARTMAKAATEGWLVKPKSARKT